MRVQLPLSWSGSWPLLSVSFYFGIRKFLIYTGCNVFVWKNSVSFNVIFCCNKDNMIKQPGMEDFAGQLTVASLSHYTRTVMIYF